MIPIPFQNSNQARIVSAQELMSFDPSYHKHTAP